uniref:Sterol O-acyltransferase 1 n=2 Tax=Ceratitis capitata TaxID=7213 RepID=W8AZZ4_CERCA
MTDRNIACAQDVPSNQINALPSEDNMQKDSTQLQNSPFELNYLRERLLGLENILLKDFKKRLDEEIEGVVQELRQHELQTNEFHGFAKPQNTNTWSNRVPLAKETPNGPKGSTVGLEKSTNSADNLKNKHKKQPRPLPDKVFVIRESYLTALLEVDHMRTIYHIFACIFLILIIQSISYDYLTEGR